MWTGRAQGLSLLGVVVVLLPSCGSQQSTATAMAIAGTAAVIVGASMAADNQCEEANAEGGSAVLCSSGLGQGARNVGTGVAIAGAGLAAAGYALQPKGPDRLQKGSNALPAPASPYRLIRQTPTPPEPVAEAPSASAPAAGDAPCGPVVAPELESEKEGNESTPSTPSEASNAEEAVPCASGSEATPPVPPPLVPAASGEAH